MEILDEDPFLAYGGYLVALRFAMGPGSSGGSSTNHHHPRFEDINYPHDTFTQLLGINNSGVIAGYHNFNMNSGFTLVLPKSFTTEKYPNSMQTQVIGINNHEKRLASTSTRRAALVGSITGRQPIPVRQRRLSRLKFNQLLGRRNAAC
jgi:hypothetical protein